MDAASGFFGKLPSHGDFVRRGLPDPFVLALDGWVQAVIGSLRQGFDADWEDRLRAMPTWRFVLDAGLAGSTVWVGIMLPSADRVGRLFPLCVAAALPPATAVFRCAALCADWIEGAEDACVRTLQGLQPDLAAFEGEIADLRSRLPPVLRLSSRAGSCGGPDLDQRVIGQRIAAQAPLDLAFCDALEALTRARLGQLSLWWSDGDAGLGASWACHPGWPDPAWFAGQLVLPAVTPEPECAAADLQSHWATWPIRSEEAGSGLLAASSPPAGLTAADWSDAGKVRSINEDSVVMNPAAGLWAVADGMGGHAHGEFASGLVADALRHMSAHPDLRQAVAAVIAALQQVNARLREHARDPHNGFDAGTTVVALLVREGSAAVVWAGDSRLYRLRAGRLDVLTRDHSSRAQAGVDASASLLDLLAAPAGELTRAIGGDDTLDADVGYFELEVGDRLLLCSDGLYTEVAETGLIAVLQAASAEESVARLAARFAQSQARDNASAVVLMRGPAIG